MSDLTPNERAMLARDIGIGFERVEKARLRKEVRGDGTVAGADAYPPVYLTWHVPEEQGALMAVPAGEEVEDLKMHLAYLGPVEHIDSLRKAVAEFADKTPPMHGWFSGGARFQSADPDYDAWVLVAEVPALDAMVDDLVPMAKTATGIEKVNAGFVPHVTLRYLKEEQQAPEPPHYIVPLTIDRISLQVGDESETFRLGGVVDPDIIAKDAKSVGPHARDKLKGLIAHYMKKPHPFTSCVRDNTKRFGPDRAKRICATLKDIGHGNPYWRGKSDAPGH